MATLDEKISFGDNVRHIIETPECTVFQLLDESGEGTMTLYNIFDGAYMMVNDMHLTSCVSHFKQHDGSQLLCIDHCREGRIENEIADGAYCYLQEHELRVDNRHHHSGPVSLPLCHYHGITLTFDLPPATASLKGFFGGFSVDLYALADKYCDDARPFVIHSNPGIEHIFSELYHVPQKIKADYLKVKALELLLYLDALEISDAKEARPYFYKSQVEKIKAIHALITADLERHYTMEALAERFQISLTAMKTCFKEIYGDSMYSYLKRYRMNVAASMLRQSPDRSVADIAGAVGYESPSKFATAFRQVMGQSPMAYRKSFF
ncbi:MAG: AraC family transcriptional regulator [Peptococcaceae bacterium]|nr:AraC family transcriptional regulator [Peptococcaceae bacterium]